jgi:hypothetical protein
MRAFYSQLGGRVVSVANTAMMARMLRRRTNR